MLCTGRTAHRWSRSIALPFLDRGTRRGWGVSVTPRPLFIPGKYPVPLVQEAGWALGPVWTGAENLAPTGIRFPDRPARNQSLCVYSSTCQNLPTLRILPANYIICLEWFSQHRIIFPVLMYIQQDATLHNLHVSGGNSIHHQKRIQLYLQHLVFVTPLLIPAATAVGSGNGVTNTRCCRYSCMRSWWWVEVPPEHVEQFPDKINCVTLHLVGYTLEYY